MKVGRLAWKVLKLLVLLALTAAALAIVAAVFWTQIKEWIYSEWFLGNDTPHYIHHVVYHLKHLRFPVNAWDHQCFYAVPRIVDLAWLQNTMTALLAKAIGLYEALKIYPMISFGLGALFSYLLFWELSGSILLSLGMAISLVLSQGYYEALFSSGVVLSAIAQMFTPAQLYFLVRFLKGGGYRNVLLAAVMSALGLASHGALGMFFGFIPAFIFVLFSNRETESLISKKTIFNAFVFGAATLCVGALVVWPFLLLSLQGGWSGTHWIGKEAVFDPGTIKMMIDHTDQGVIYGLIVAIPLGLIFWLARRGRFVKTVRPVLVLLVLYFLWMLTYTVGGNRMYAFMFPWRLFWLFPILVGGLAAALLAPLSIYKARNLILSGLKFLVFGLLKVGVLGAILLAPVISISAANIDNLVPNFMEMVEVPQKWETLDIADRYREFHGDKLELIDLEETNVRLWAHGHDIDLYWAPLSDMPLSEGYGHPFNYWGRLFQGWFYGVMSYVNWESKEIPREMAEQQSLWYIDWHGIKYIVAWKGWGEFDIAGRFYTEPPPPYIKKSKTYEGNRTTFVVAPEYTSPLIAGVDVPVIGFVGSGDGYMSFVQDIAMLNLNTSYVIPVKLSESIASIPSDRLALVDALVIYEFEKGFSFLYGRGWNKVLNFAKNGGKVWIETGGNSIERESPRLPAVFPITANQYGPLGEEWQPGGKLAKEIDFPSLGKLVWRDTPWKLSYTSPEAVKEGAEILLTQKDHPIAVVQNIGEGRVLWTGANSWYRPEEFRQKGKGMKEVRFIELFMEELFEGLEPSRPPQPQVERSTPEHVRVRGEGFSGVAFKDYHWPGWGAVVEAGGKRRKVPIFTAGPVLMYVPIPKDMRTGEIKVSIDYHGDPFYWLCFFVSAASLLMVFLYLIFGDRILGRFGLEGLAQRVEAIKVRGIREQIAGWREAEED